ncbi:MAG: hypothetical protein WAM58_04455, partial [Candidatus Acidiferrum sp.]
MTRRSGQLGNLIKQSGWWRVRFRLDQPDTEKRIQMSVKVALVSAGLTRSELARRAKQIVQDVTSPSFCTTANERVYITTSSVKGANGGSQGAVG